MTRKDFIKKAVKAEALASIISYGEEKEALLESANHWRKEAARTEASTLSNGSCESERQLLSSDDYLEMADRSQALAETINSKIQRSALLEAARQWARQAFRRKQLL